MIIITGANGKLGRAVVEQLLTRVPASQVGVSVRDPDAARALSDRGVRVRRGDFADPASLTHAFEGAWRVLIVSIASLGEAKVAQQRAAIEAARAAGASRIFYTSHAGAAPDSPFAPMPDHAATEQALRASGVASTALRNGFYADTAAMLLGRAVGTGELAAPADGPIDYTSHADLAESTAIALADEALDAETLYLTGAEALDLDAVAAIGSELTGRPIRRTVVSDDVYRERMVAAGVPEPRAAMMVGLFAASRQGRFTRVDPTMARLLGRPPMTVRDTLKASLTK
ncbi:MAG: SDR family NAD(P)-dependent oxidoreductase [Myxococcales bacterium]|nr:MAG: SDR family NAD(P)-dependent oxidoreductase [Myxococcales bacterium]